MMILQFIPGMVFQLQSERNERAIPIFDMDNITNSPWGVLTGIRPAKIATKLLLSGMTDSEAADYFAREYGAHIQKARLAVSVARAELPIRDAMYDDGVSIYIGIPFCPTRCLYCSFVTCGTRQAAKLTDKYIEMLKREISYTAQILSENCDRIETIYIGGGTPTTLSAKQLDELLAHIYSEFDLSSCREFTVEAGRPDTVTEDKLLVLKKHNVTRISINPQSMNSETLKIIGRAHTPEQIEEAFALARKCGFDNINMDVIAGLPGENIDMFKNTLNKVESLSPENTTVHVMSIKRSSRLHEYLDKYTLPNSETVADMVGFAYEFLGSLGKHPYYMYRQKNQLGNLENVGYSKQGFDNLYNVYIMEEIQSIISLGCGGVTKTVDKKLDKIERIFNVKEPQDYIERIDEMLKRKDVLRKD